MIDSRSVNKVKKENCCGRHACYNVCPKFAINMVADKEGFLYPNVSVEKCVNCGMCLNICPSVTKLPLNSGDKAYACYARNCEERLSSSSGGFFSVLARKFLNEEGIIFGASFNEKMEVEHLGISKTEELHKLKGTKYVQSKIGTNYKDVKRELLKGKKVLFSGTPCQVAGLEAFLGEKYDNLLSIDLICHGVPSPSVWKRYLNERFGEDNVNAMQFRNKREGISNVKLDYMLKSGEIVQESYNESPYIKGFIENFYTRPSCFRCNFKGIKRYSDITIGDFWSAKEFHPEIDDSYGVSGIIVHTAKGERWLETVKDQLILYDAQASEIAVWNECLLESVKENPYRQLFFEKWTQFTIEDMISELARKKTKVKDGNDKKKKFQDWFTERIQRWLA